MIIDYLSVTFYFGCLIKNKWRQLSSVSPATGEKPYLTLQKLRYKLYYT